MIQLENNVKYFWEKKFKSISFYWTKKNIFLDWVPILESNRPWPKATWRGKDSFQPMTLRSDSITEGSQGRDWGTWRKDWSQNLKEICSLACFSWLAPVALAGQPDPETHLLLPCQCWDYKWKPRFLLFVFYFYFFNMSSGDQMHTPKCLWSEHLMNWAICLGLKCWE